MSNDSTAVKVTMNLTSDNVDYIEKTADKPGQTKTGVVNHAISLDKYFREAIERGAKILIEEKGGQLREVLIR